MKKESKQFWPIESILTIIGLLLIIICMTFGKLIGFFHFLLLLTTGILLSIITLVITLSRKRNSNKSKYITLTIFVCLTLFLFLGQNIYGYIGDYFMLMPKLGRLNVFVKEIKDYKNIQNMSDGQRHYKELNNHLITYDSIKVDTPQSRFIRKTEMINDVLTSEQISKEKYNQYRNELIYLGFIRFEIHGDAIIFTIDGMLDNCYGYAYCETEYIPKNTKCGRIVVWRQIIKNWYSFGTT